MLSSKKEKDIAIKAFLEDVAVMPFEMSFSSESIMRTGTVFRSEDTTVVIVVFIQAENTDSFFAKS